MSRISWTPVVLPDGVTCSFEGAAVVVCGAKGKLSVAFPESLRIDAQEKGVFVRTREEIKLSEIPKELSILCGTFKRLIQNMVMGVSQGFSKSVELIGVGYRAEMQGNTLKLNLGYSHDVLYAIPDGITVRFEKPTMFFIEGIDKQLVGQVASEVRKFRPPEPYKGKGIRVAGEFIRRKEGKAK